MYAEVILPVPLRDTYTYIVPPEMEAQIVSGCLVLVGFGKNKQYTGIVARLVDEHSEAAELKPLLGLMGDRPLVTETQLAFWKWIANYYLCCLGEVYKAVLPAGFHSERSSSYVERSVTAIGLSSTFREKQDAAFELVKRSPKQDALFRFFLNHTHQTNPPDGLILRKDLLEQSGATPAILRELVQKGILEQIQQPVSRLSVYTHATTPLFQLDEVQTEAHRQINESLKEKDVCLLHGVTSSGKTEIYTHLIEETIAQGKQVLYLLPEIALTAQLTERLQRFFGDKLVVYHSRVNQHERVEIWNSLLQDDSIRIVLGVRSSVFLPFRNLGLIIVDEEHEPSYKQQDPAPRYHARNAAIILARLSGAKVLLGSATPSIESFYQAQKGRYGYVKLNRRFSSTPLPVLLPVDVKDERKRKRMKNLFSPLLQDKMRSVLERGEQVMLFHNRRGFSTQLACKICDWTPKCNYCDISLTYHKGRNRLSCHYCGAVYRLPRVCPECGSTEFKPLGFGTEKVEEEVRELFPGVPVARMDADTTKSQQALEELISDFAEGKTRVLIGTQMISKGLDFDQVTLVGILSADALMNFPDFRSYERAYQLMAQVAGRAGRRQQQGEVVLQTTHPDHPLIRTVLTHHYEGMYEMQLEERQLFLYPPFSRIIAITLKYNKETIVQEAAAQYGTMLREKFGNRVMGPDKPPVARIQKIYLRRLLLKVETGVSMPAVRELLSKTQQELQSNDAYKYVVMQYDVDPV